MRDFAPNGHFLVVISYNKQCCDKADFVKMLNVGFKIVIRIALAFLLFVGFLLRPLQILYGYVFTPKRKLPVFRDQLLEIPAVDLAEKIRNREVSE